MSDQLTHTAKRKAKALGMREKHIAKRMEDGSYSLILELIEKNFREDGPRVIVAWESGNRYASDEAGCLPSSPLDHPRG